MVPPSPVPNRRHAPRRATLALAAALLSLAASAPIASSPGAGASAPAGAPPAARGVERVASAAGTMAIRQEPGKPEAKATPRGAGGWAIFGAGLAVAIAIVGRRRRGPD